MARQPTEPEVIVIYVPGGDQCHMYGALRDDKQVWKFTKTAAFPSHELNEFLAWCLERGMQVLDVRLLASMKVKGMGKATPIVIAHDIPMQLAIEQAKRIHKLAVKFANED